MAHDDEPVLGLADLGERRPDHQVALQIERLPGELVDDRRCRCLRIVPAAKIEHGQLEPGVRPDPLDGRTAVDADRRPEGLVPVDDDAERPAEDIRVETAGDPEEAGDVYVASPGVSFSSRRSRSWPNDSGASARSCFGIVCTAFFGDALTASLPGRGSRIGSRSGSSG